jgi:hypothetical protein
MRAVIRDSAVESSRRKVADYVIKKFEITLVCSAVLHSRTNRTAPETWTLL